MSYMVKCEVCGIRVDADPQMVGQQMICTECKGQFTVPITSITAGLVEGDLWIQKSLGAGNIGEMFLAKRLSNNQKLYLKALSPAVTVDPQAVNQFLGRLLQARDLSHPNLQPVLETGQMAEHYIYVMPYVDGRPLNEMIAADGPLPEREALKIVLKVGRCLRAAWEDFGIVHGALRPSNIVIDGEGEPHILETGNFKRILAGTMLTLDHLNKAGTVADYMSPEQAQGWPQLDCRADIYALGATLYFMLTGQSPYRGPDTRTVLHQHLNSPIPDPRDLNADITDETVELLFGMMEKNTEERFQSWRELCDETKELLKNRAPGTETEIALTTQLHMHALQAEQLQPPRKSPVMLIVLAFVAILTLGMIVIGVAYSLMSEKPIKPTDTRPQVNGETNPTENDVLVKKIDAIMGFHEKNPDKADFTITKLQMLLAKEAKTDAQRRMIQTRIDEVQKSGGEDPQKPPVGPREPQKAKYYRDFLFLGPFQYPAAKVYEKIKPAGRRDFPTLNARIKAKDGKRMVGWERINPPLAEGKNSLRRDTDGPKENVNIFAVAGITAKNATPARLWLGHDDDLTIWLNGREIYKRAGAVQQDQASVNIELEPGINVLLINCRNDSGDWWFTLRLTQPDSDLEPADVEFAAPKR